MQLLVHGGSIVRHAILPIGQLSEEADEFYHKDIQEYRLYHTRKFTRVGTVSDLFNRIPTSSDPQKSSIA